MEDFDSLTEHIEKKVPHPFYASSQSAYDSVKNAVLKKLNSNMSVIQFYRTVYPLIQILNDAHFSIYLNDNSNKSADSVLYFPFKVLIDSNRLFIRKNLSHETTIPQGADFL